MVLTYLVVGLICVAGLVACAVASPSTDRTKMRAAGRRRTFVKHNPTHVNSQDIRTQLVRDGVSAQQAGFITETAADHGIKPFTMWLWLQQFDAEALGIVVAADVSHHELLTHISNGTVPDLEELALFASANGLDIVGRPMRTPRHQALVDFGITAPKRVPLPPALEQSNWPGLPTPERPPRLGEGGLAA